MNKTLSVRLPMNTIRAMQSLMAERGISRSDIVREALRDYLFIHKFRAIRRKMVKKAARMGIHTDQDVFDRIS